MSKTSQMQVHVSLAGKPIKVIIKIPPKIRSDICPPSPGISSTGKKKLLTVTR